MTSIEQRIFPKSYRRKRVVDALFEAITRKARQPALFGEQALADTLSGRFHAVTLFASLLLPRLARAGLEGERISDRLYRKIFDSFDAALRETGVGDASIARKVRAMGEQFFGIGRALQEALDRDDTDRALETLLLRNDIVEDGANSKRITAALILALGQLDRCSEEDLLTGNIGW